MNIVGAISTMPFIGGPTAILATPLAWGNPVELSVVDKLAAPDVLVHYPMHGPLLLRVA